MTAHPNSLFAFDHASRKRLQAAISNHSVSKMRPVLERFKDEPAALEAVAALLRIDDRLIVLHRDAKREAKRDEFLEGVLAWARDGAREDFTAALEKIIDQTGIIEAGYRLIRS